MKIKISKYVKLGLLMVFSLSVLVWGLSYLKGHDFFKPVNYYYTRYHRVDGLLESSLVTVNGFRIGTVKKIQFAADRSGDLIVTFMIDNNFKIPRNSSTHIISSDIMGTRAVKLIYSDNTGYYSSGDTIPGEIESDLKEQVSSQLLPLKNKAEEMLSSVDSVMTELKVVLDEDARKNLSESFNHINQTTRNLEKTSADLQEVISKEKTNISSLIGNMKAISDTLSSLPLVPVVNDIAHAVNTLQGILSKINSDKSTAGLLLNDDELYHNLTGLTNNLESLLSDIRTNPKRYVHFSAFDKGKNLYFNTPSTASVASQKLIFKIRLITTTTRLQLHSTVFSGLDNVEEFENNGVFSYFTGESFSFANTEKMLEVARHNFPDATVIAYKDGKEIKLEKAMRLIK